MPEAIEVLLKALKLPAFQRYYQRHQQQAIEQGYGHIRYLSGLCDQEVADRYQNRFNAGPEKRGCRPEKVLPI